jgi:drug/metabolite transporter (DMT)-like permease
MAERDGESGVSPYLFLTLAMVFFATNVIIGRAVHGEVPPVGLSFWRWTAASLLFLPFGLPHVRRQWDLIVRHWKVFVGLSTAMILFGNTVIYIGLNYTIALNAGIVPVARPMIIVALSWVIFRTAVTGGQVLGIIIAMVGVLVIAARGDLSALASLQFNNGDLIVFAGNIGIAVYQVFYPLAPRELHPNAMLQITFLLGIPLLAPFYALETIYIAPVVPNLVTVSAILAVAIFPSMFAIYCMNRGMTMIGPSRAGIFNYLQPLFVMVMAITLLGEAVEIYHLIAFTLVIAGIVVANRGRPTSPVP